MNHESFTDFLDAFGATLKPRLAYEPDRDVHSWQRAFREALGSLRGPLPPRVSPEATVVESFDEPDHTRHLLNIPVSEFHTMVAYLLVPKDLTEGERRAGLIVSHGHAAFGIDSICGLQGMDEPRAEDYAYALQAVRAGFVVLTPAWWGWVGRDGHVEKVGPHRDKCNVIQMAASMYGINVIELHIQDGQAAIDALAARPEVDAERIGCAGNSYGGRTTMWLTIYDERIKAAVASGCMNLFRERSLKLKSCAIQYPHGLRRYGDVGELFALIAPRPLQVQAGEKDELLFPEDRKAILAIVRDAYNQYDASENLDYQAHPHGHRMIWDLAEPFLNKHLRPEKARDAASG